MKTEEDGVNLFVAFLAILVAVVAIETIGYLWIF
jgi:hypothetical protein